MKAILEKTACFVLLLISINGSYLKAQTVANYIPGADPNLVGLRIGDKVPDVTVTDIINYPKTFLKLSDLKGKIIILDFWDKYCSACIGAFPRMEKLQEEFKDKIQILLVARNKKNELELLFQNSIIIKQNKLPILIGDTVLHKLFPHMAVPFHVWIDDKGMVKAMTNGSSTTSKNIQMLLEGKSLDLPVRVDERDLNILRAPLIKQLSNETVFGGLLSYSLICKKYQGTAQSTTEYIMDSLGNYIGMKALNQTIIQFFNNIHNPGMNSKVIVELKDSKNRNKYYPPEDDGEKVKWDLNNVYCYEALFPQRIRNLKGSELLKERHLMMKQDLEQFFMIQSFIENRPIKCWVLYKSPGRDSLNINNLKSKGGEKHFWEMTKNGLVAKNTSFDALVVGLRDYFLGNGEEILIDEAGYKGEIDFSLKVRTSINETQEQLKKYGLFLKEEVRAIKCLVLKEI